MEIKFMQTRITKLTMILIKIAIMGLIMAGIILINKKYMSNAEGSEKVIRSAKLMTDKKCTQQPRYFVE